MSSHERFGLVLAAIATTIVGSSVAASSLLTEYPILGGQAIRYVIASMLLFGWAKLTGKRIRQLTSWELAWLSGVALTGLAGFNVLLIEALMYTDPSIVGIVIGTAPVVMAIAGALQMKRRPSVGVVAAAVIVAGGAAFAQGATGESTTSGLLLSLGAMLGAVCFSLLAVPVLGRLGPVAVSAHATWLAAVFLSIAAIATEGRSALRIPTPDELGALVYLAVMVTAVTFVCWYSSVERLGTDRAGLFNGLIPVSALFTVAVVGTGEVTPPRLIGAALVALGIVVGAWAARRDLSS